MGEIHNLKACARQPNKFRQSPEAIDAREKNGPRNYGHHSSVELGRMRYGGLTESLCQPWLTLDTGPRGTSRQIHSRGWM